MVPSTAAAVFSEQVPQTGPRQSLGRWKGDFSVGHDARYGSAGLKGSARGHPAHGARGEDSSSLLWRGIFSPQRGFLLQSVAWEAEHA